MADSGLAGKGIYESLQDKYYDVLDWLDAKGIPVYKPVDWLEEKNIPSFPVAVLVVLAVIIGLFFLASNFALEQRGTLDVLVKDSEGNNLSGVTVVASFREESVSGSTGTDGIARLNVPLNTELEIRATKTDFSSTPTIFTLATESDSTNITLSRVSANLFRTFELLKSSSNEIFEEPVEIAFTCTLSSCSGELCSQSKTNSNGFVSIEVPANCGLINVSVESPFSAQNSVFDPNEGDSLQLFLSGAQTQTGSVLVSVRDQSGVSLSGINVNLIQLNESANVGVHYQTKETTLSGTVTFIDVPGGKYFVTVTDETGTFAEFDSSKSGDVKPIAIDSSISFPIVLSKNVVGTIKLVVRDKANDNPVSNATVKISKGSSLLFTKETDPNGRLDVSVGEQLDYSVVVDKDGYLIEELSVAPSTSERTVLLTQATVENSQSLTVSVLDERGKPIENALLSLFEVSSNNSVGGEITTGIDGKGVFERVKEGQYFVSVLKPGFDEVSSAPFTLNNRQQNAIEVSLSIGFGNLEVSVFDDKKSPLAGGKVSVIDFSTGQVLEQRNSDARAIATFSIRADKTVYVVGTQSGYLPFTSVPIAIAKDATKELSVDLRKDIGELSIELTGIVSGDGIVRESTTPNLSPGQNFKARFLLLVPKGSLFEQAGAHIRTGAAANNSSNQIEKDPIYILDVKSAYDQILGGTSYTPPKGFGEDSLHFSSANSKWVELYYNRPAEGVYEIEADIVVSQNAKPGAALDLWYRAFGKTGSGFFRFPQDAELGSNESSAQKQGFYAQAKNKKFSVGATSLCFGEFCLSLSVENTSDGISTSIVDEFGAEVGNLYELKYSFSNISSQIFSDASLDVADESGSVFFRNVEMTDVSGRNFTQAVESSSFSIPIGSISENDSFGGTMQFDVQKDGTAELTIRVLAGDASKEVVFEKVINVSVVPAEEMVIDIIPKAIVPFVKNNVIVKVSEALEEKTISGATVTVKMDKEILKTGKTDSLGLFSFTLSPQNVGSKIVFVAEKKGFKAVERTIEISENVIVTVPSSIRENLIVGELAEKELFVQFVNAAQIPLTIVDVFAGSEFNRYVDVDVSSDLIGTVLSIDQDTNASIVISLTNEGASVDEPKTVKGNLNIIVENAEIAKKWNAKIPLEVRIGFGDEVDDSSCLEIDPDNWEIFSSGEAKTLSLTVRNLCKVSGENISLSNLSAKVNLGAENSVGSFIASADFFDREQKIGLTNSFKVLSSLFEETAEETIVIDFEPIELTTATQDISIDFKATHFTSKGPEEISRKLKVTVNINDLLTCISVQPSDQITMRTCPFNTGYDMYQGRFSGQYNYGGYPQHYGQGYSNPSYGGGYGYSDSQTYGNYPNDYGYNSGNSGSYNQYNSGNQFTGGNVIPGNSDPNYRQFDPFQQQYGYGTGVPNYLVPEGGLPNTYNQDYYSPFNRTYPFNNNFQNNYVGDIYNSGFNGRFNCGGTELRLVNNCSESVDVTVNPQQGLLVRKNQVTIPKGKQESLFVEPSYFLGIYPIELAGKLSKSKEPPVLFSKVTVNVENPLTQNYRDCISINPARKLKFNNFFGKPVELQVVNTCYNEGVQLLRTNDSIFFPESVLRSPTDVQSSGRHEMIENWALLDETFETGPDGRTTQVQKYEIFKALKNYCNLAPNFPRPDLESPFQVLGNLRYFFSSGYYSVQSRTNMVVNFFTPYGSRTSINFPLIIEDWWEALPYAERIVSYGDPALKPSACINRNDVLNFQNRYKGCIPESELELLEAQGHNTVQSGKLMTVSVPIRQAQNCQQYFSATGATTPGQNPNTVAAGKLEVGGCGTVDTVSDLTPNVIEKDGLRIGLGISDGKEIELTFDASEWREKGKPKVTINERLFFTVTRLVPSSSERTSLQLSFCVDGTGTGVTNPDGNQPSVGPQALACENGGQTGTSVYDKAGFGKLKFDWRYANVGRSDCDEGKFFCDASQASIAFSKKADEIKKIILANVSSTNKSCGVEGNDCSGLQNSKELYRYFADTLNLTDDVSHQQMNFFAVNGRLVENTTAKKTFNDKDNVKSIRQVIENNPDPLNVINQLVNLLDIIEQDNELKNEVVFSFRNNPNGIGKKEANGQYVYNDQIEELGFDAFSQARFVMTFNEMKTLVNNLRDTTKEGAVICASGGVGTGDVNCKVDEENSVVKEIKKSSTPNGTPIKAEFLQAFVNDLEDVVFGVRNAREVSSEKALAVVSALKSVSVAGYDNFEDFYKENISFKAGLINDSFSDDFKQDFATFYSNDGSEFVDNFSDWWTFSGDTKESGEYNVTLSVGWSGSQVNSVKTEFVLAKNIQEINAEFAKNPLFFMPLNGNLGLDSTNVNREDYGVAFKAEGQLPSQASGVLKFANYGVPQDGFHPQSYIANSNGLMQMSLSFKNTFEEANSGEVLSVGVQGESGSLTFFPTDPIALEIGVKKTAQANRPIGFLYSLNAGKGLVEQNTDWTVVKDTVFNQQRPRTLKSGLHSANDLCQTGSNRFNGFVLNGGANGEISLRTIFFVPTRAFEIVNDSKLNILCFKDSAATKKVVDYANSTSSRPLNSGDNELNSGQKNRLVELYNLKDLVGRIKDNSICLDLDGSFEKNMKLLWNKKQVMDSLGVTQ